MICCHVAGELTEDEVVPAVRVLIERRLTHIFGICRACGEGSESRYREGAREIAWHICMRTRPSSYSKRPHADEENENLPAPD